MLHGRALIRRNSIENKIDQILRRLFQLLQRFGGDDAVIQDITEVRVRQGSDNDAAGGVFQLASCLFLRHVGAVVAEDVDQVVDGVEEAEHLVDFADANV